MHNSTPASMREINALINQMRGWDEAAVAMVNTAERFFRKEVAATVVIVVRVAYDPGKQLLLRNQLDAMNVVGRSLPHKILNRVRKHTERSINRKLNKPKTSRQHADMVLASEWLCDHANYQASASVSPEEVLQFIETFDTIRATADSPGSLDAVEVLARKQSLLMTARGRLEQIAKASVIDSVEREKERKHAESLGIDTSSDDWLEKLAARLGQIERDRTAVAREECVRVMVEELLITCPEVQVTDIRRGRLYLGDSDGHLVVIPDARRDLWFCPSVDIDMDC